MRNDPIDDVLELLRDVSRRLDQLQTTTDALDERLTQAASQFADEARRDGIRECLRIAEAPGLADRDVIHHNPVARTIVAGIRNLLMGTSNAG